MSDQQYDNTNKGAIFGPQDTDILRSGKLNVGGVDKYVMIVQRKAQDGSRILNLYVQAGRIFANGPEQKNSPNSPDVSGNQIYIDGKRYRVSGWKKTAQNTGQPYTSLSVQEVDDQGNVINNNNNGGGGGGQQSQSSGGGSADYDDDIPF